MIRKSIHWWLPYQCAYYYGTDIPASRHAYITLTCNSSQIVLLLYVRTSCVQNSIDTLHMYMAYTHHVDYQNTHMLSYFKVHAYTACMHACNKYTRTKTFTQRSATNGSVRSQIDRSKINCLRYQQRLKAAVVPQIALQQAALAAAARALH
jgi:hypothetical protein